MQDPLNHSTSPFFLNMSLRGYFKAVDEDGDTIITLQGVIDDLNTRFRELLPTLCHEDMRECTIQDYLECVERSLPYPSVKFNTRTNSDMYNINLTHAANAHVNLDELKEILEKFFSDVLDRFLRRNFKNLYKSTNRKGMYPDLEIQHDAARREYVTVLSRHFQVDFERRVPYIIDDVREIILYYITKKDILNIIEPKFIEFVEQIKAISSRIVEAQAAWIALRPPRLQYTDVQTRQHETQYREALNLALDDAVRLVLEGVVALPTVAPNIESAATASINADKQEQKEGQARPLAPVSFDINVNAQGFDVADNVYIKISDFTDYYRGYYVFYRCDNRWKAS
jgi:hypothetical protein